MKGIAILCVVIGHYVASGPFSLIIWSFHMPLFVFISGYFFNPYKENFFKKALKSYLKPYFIVWLLIALTEIVFPIYEGYNIIETIENRLMSGIFALASNNTLNRPDNIPKIGVIWFLNALFISILYSHYIFKIKKAHLQLVAIIFIITIFAIITQRTCIPMGLHYGAAFCLWIWLGYWFRQKYYERFLTELKKYSFLLLLLFIWICVVLLEAFSGYTFNIIYLTYHLYGLEVLGALAATLFIMAICKICSDLNLKICQPLSYLGRISLWILCVHGYSLEFFSPLFANIRLGEAIHCLFDISIAIILYKIYNLNRLKQ